MHVVPNGEIKSVSNKTRGWSRAVVDVAIAYDENVDRALRVLRDEAARLSHRRRPGGAARRAVSEVLGRRVAERHAPSSPHDDPHPARLAVGRGA